MKKTRIAAALAILSCLCLSGLSAADKLAKKPRASEVVIVARFEISPALDRNFFSNYAYIKTPYVEMGSKPKKGETPADTLVLYTGNPANKANSVVMYYDQQTDFGALGETGYAKLSIPKSREIVLKYVRVYIVNNPLLFLDLPIQRKIVVPEGVNYVYLGTFGYEMENEYFDIKSISLSDEFDGARDYVAKTFGAGAELSRVNLQKLEEAKETK
jgi:hypothetical protein